MPAAATLAARRAAGVGGAHAEGRHWRTRRTHGGTCSNPAVTHRHPQSGSRSILHAADIGQLLRQERQRDAGAGRRRSEEHTSELQSLMRISYAVFCLKKKKYTKNLTSILNIKYN